MIKPMSNVDTSSELVLSASTTIMLFYDGLNCSVCDDDRRHCRLSGTREVVREPSAQIDSVDDGHVFLMIIRAAVHMSRKRRKRTLSFCR